MPSLVIRMSKAAVTGRPSITSLNTKLSTAIGSPVAIRCKIIPQIGLPVTDGHMSRYRRPTISSAGRWPISATGLM